MTVAAGIPLPPRDLSIRALPLDFLPKGTVFHRIHAAAKSAIYFDKGDGGRFNAPDGSFGTMYAANATDGAFAEVFLRDVSTSVVSEAFVATRALSLVRLLRDARVVRLRGSGLHAIGATAVVSAIWPYSVPQAWAKALFEHPSAPDGIAYRSRHDDSEQCIAFFERLPPYLDVTYTARDLLSQSSFHSAAAKYGVGVV